MNRYLLLMVQKSGERKPVEVGSFPPIIYVVLDIPGCLGFSEQSTVCFEANLKSKIHQPEWFELKYSSLAFLNASTNTMFIPWLNNVFGAHIVDGSQIQPLNQLRFIYATLAKKYGDSAQLVDRRISTCFILSIKAQPSRKLTGNPTLKGNIIFTHPYIF